MALKPFLQTPSEWLSQRITQVAAEITKHHFLAHPQLKRQFGSRGRRKCTEDTAYHLHFLAEAIAADSPKIFVDYIGWAKIMLLSRGIDPRELGNSLESMVSVLQKKAHRTHKEVFVRYIGLAMNALPTLPNSMPTFIDPGAPYARIANFYLNSLLVLDREKAISGILQEIENGLSMKDLFHHVLYVVQQEVGRLWQQNQITVVQEHFCTAVTDLLTVKLRHGTLNNTREVSALAVCAEGEEHCLGLKMLSELLESDGWKVIYIGSKSPTSDVLKYLEAETTDLVVISVATALNLGAVRKLIGSIKALPTRDTPRVMVGGLALKSNPTLWKTLGADAFADSIVAGLEEANRLVRQ